MLEKSRYDLKITILTSVESNNFYSAAKDVRDKIRVFGDNFINGDEIICNVSSIAPHVMSGTTSHDKTLVSLINKAYAYDSEKFGLIIETLAKRDEDECYEKEIDVPLKDDNGYYEYLEKVADDEDLKSIINFVRMWNGDEKTIFV